MPDKGPAASATRTRNFGQLVAAAGDEEALGAALGMTLARVKELREGYGFTNETAFHIESELQLPSGWLDRQNAKVDESVFQPLPPSTEAAGDTHRNVPKDAAKQSHPEATEQDAASGTARAKNQETEVPKSAKEAVATPRKRSQTVELPQISAPGLVTPGDPSAAAAQATAGHARRGDKAPKHHAAASQQSPAAPAAAAAAALPAQSAAGTVAAEEPRHPTQPSAAAQGSDSPKETQMARRPRINEPEAMMEIRRKNIMVLTDFPGGKTGIGKLLGKSPANISHVLHGKKKFTRDVADEFEGALQLTPGWLDTARQPNEVPAHVRSLVLEAFNREGGKAPGAAAKTPRAPRAPRVAAAPSPAAATKSPAEALVAQMIPPAATAATATPPVARQVVNQPAVSAQMAIELNQADLQARPMAQALIRVIMVLSRNNELPEDKCLRLLNEVTMMATPQTAAT